MPDLPGLMARADRVMVCSSPGYDFGSGAVPANVRYVGPQLDDVPDEGSGEWRAGEPGQPLVLVDPQPVIPQPGKRTASPAPHPSLPGASP